LRNRSCVFCKAVHTTSLQLCPDCEARAQAINTTNGKPNITQ
jgi:RNA polymerase subunit RPABC4/transcription elongation factor Spt4